MEPTECAKKLKLYLDDNGIRRKWAAEKIGISPASLSGYLLGVRPLPVKCFDRVVIFTKGKISKKDLLTEFFSKNQDAND